MQLFALDSAWSDFYTIAGFIFSILGLIVGVVGFGIAIYQIIKTKRAAEAAQEAARKTLAESKDSYERFVGAYASRLLSELQNAVNAKDWKLASIRCQDVAELMATLPFSGHEASDEMIIELVAGLRDFSQTFTDNIPDKKSQLARGILKKWRDLVNSLHSRLDQLRAPFRENTYGKVCPNDTPESVPKDRSGPPGKDESGTSELGPKPSGEPDS